MPGKGGVKKMKKINLINVLFVSLILTSILFIGCSSGPFSDDEKKIILGAKLPPTGPVTRSYPKLVNYCHVPYDENQVSYREERLAQWDVIILNPDMVKYENISLNKIRETNPRIEILAWVPFGGEPSSMDIAAGIPGEDNQDNWYGKKADGDYIISRWGGHMMNPYKSNFAWPEYIINYVKEHYIGNYDGVMFDILQEWVPTFASDDVPPTFDTDEDGDFDEDDRIFYREGIIYLMENMRNDCPDTIITGNGGIPWTENCPYYEYANGCMHENALGDEFGTYWWDGHYGNNPSGCYGVWDGYRTCIDSANPDGLERFHFISVDVRMGRTEEGALKLGRLSDEDLRRMRLGLCTSLLDEGGYFGFDRGDTLHGQLWWFDEYDADLGNPVDTYQQGAFGEGENRNEIYSREFEKGVVIINHNETDTTVNLGAVYQDVTTKEAGTVFIIPPWDARIYLKQ
jgi:hypothetical protein